MLGVLGVGCFRVRMRRLAGLMDCSTCWAGRKGVGLFGVLLNFVGPAGLGGEKWTKACLRVGKQKWTKQTYLRESYTW